MSCSSSSSRKGMHGGGSTEFWREYIGGNSLQLFEVIYRGIQLAKIDYPEEFLAERDCIAQNLFSSHPNLNKKQHSKEEEVEDCFSAKKATCTTNIEESASALSEGGRGVDAVAVERVDERSSHRPPTITISCKVRTTDDKGSISMRGIQEKQIPPPSTTQHPRPPQSAVLKPKPIHHQPTAPANNRRRDLLDKKVYEATKRKLREAYEEEGRTKRIRRTQLLDFSQSAKLLHQNNFPSTHQLTNKAGRRSNTTNTWATGRRR